MKQQNNILQKYANIFILTTLAITAASLSVSAYAEEAKKVLRKESDYVEKWCAGKGGEVEHKLPDKTRIDCYVRDKFGAEFDWSDKWAEAIGQSLHYAAATQTAPWVVLIRREKTKLETFRRHTARVQNIIKQYELPIEMICLDPAGEETKC